ncbi:unnamed protein product, partial [Arabidopsis halleri]
ISGFAYKHHRSFISCYNILAIVNEKRYMSVVGAALKIGGPNPLLQLLGLWAGPAWEGIAILALSGGSTVVLTMSFDVFKTRMMKDGCLFHSHT